MEGRKARYIDSDSAVSRFHPHDISTGQPKPVLDYYEKRLQDLDISHWTNVHISSAFAAQAIMLYLKTDHPLLGIFDPYLFIQDLVNQRDRYCSRFLVNAVMYLGCQMYSAFNKDFIEYVDSFCSETKALSAAEEEHASPLNMAALVVASMSFMVHGRDHAVLECAKNATRMGMQLGFFPCSIGPPADLTQLPDENVRVNSHAAWGVFCWSVLLALFYRQPGVEVPQSAPNLPIPRGPSFPMVSGTSETGSFEEQDLMGSTFPALCEFWSIIHEGIWIYYGSWSDAPAEVWRPKLAEHKFREIVSWTTNLPPSLIRAKKSGPHVPVFHIWLHAALLDIVRPFRGDTAQDEQIWKTFVATDSSASTAYKASVNQLKQLVLDYRMNYETSSYSMLWHTGLLYLVNAILENPRDSDWHLYFLLCIYGYESLRRSYRISGSIGKSLLAMALRHTNMSGEEARKILKDLEHNESSPLKNRLRATFMADLKMAKVDPENATVENIAKDFESLALFNDLLCQEQMDEL
ncbi:hypothetical protein S7711_09812 [Stachybotrys chartarum IBT 7711]|uniref:Transcription factor domain-containing protein n=1 Tax=Stachybotrys chartarum (strain CBS 109288 / IBT 7711) TaxID=1280523 RepID=A0A084BBD9_STACB|nr:hypothetical protein S7711_09812 [Stachybotrys chartarum IBT 7711]